jgi:holo-[acyl-carrier protein] synthase
MAKGFKDERSLSAGRHDHEAPSVEFNVGLDIEDVERFASVSSDRSMAALFTSGEHEHCGIAENAAGRYAGTWCAKEAAIKALWPWIRLDPRRVEVVHEGDGRPAVVVSGWDAAGSGITVRVSIAHARSVASACAVAWGPPPSRTEAHGA